MTEQEARTYIAQLTLEELILLDELLKDLEQTRQL